MRGECIVEYDLEGASVLLLGAGCSGSDMPCSRKDACEHFMLVIFCYVLF
jgi:hypothetical protein